MFTRPGSLNSRIKGEKVGLIRDLPDRLSDTTDSRQDSARCAAMSSAAQTACWQGVSTWAQKRAARYQSLSTQATGAQAQQMQSAAKFFGVTSEWASACGALTPQQCAESPLIGKMQQWKASVGIPGTTTPTS